MLRSFFKFDTVKETLKIRCHIYTLTKKIIILRKIQFEPEQKKTCGIMRVKRKERNIEMSALLTVSGKIPECAGSILPSSFYGKLPD